MQLVKGFRKQPTFESAFKDIWKPSIVRLPVRSEIDSYNSFELNFIGRPTELGDHDRRVMER